MPASLAETASRSLILFPNASTSAGCRAKANTVLTFEILSSARSVADAIESCTSRLALRTLRPCTTAKAATGGTTHRPTAASWGDMKSIMPGKRYKI